MNEQLITFNWQVWDPDNTAAVGASAIAFVMPFTATLVYASGSPFVDDAGATFDIQDDTVDIVTAVGVSDHDVPGEWISTHAGGTQTPVHIVAGSLLELDFNNAAAANRFDVTLVFLVGSGWG